MRKVNEFLEGIAYRLGNFGIMKYEYLLKRIHYLEVEINQYLIIHSKKHRKKYMKDLGFKKDDSNSRQLKKLYKERFKINFE